MIQFEYDINLNHQRIIAVGDIHGDSHVLHHILVDLAKVVEIEDNVTDLKSDIRNNELQPLFWLDKLHWRKKENSIVVFCGDLVDRTRSESYTVDDEDSDIQILRTLCRLAIEAKKEGGLLIVLLGNHEIMNFEHDFRYVSPKAMTIDGLKQRKQHFKVGSKFAIMLANHSLITVRINQYVFVHGGFCTNTPSMKHLNKSMYRYLVNRNKIDDFVFEAGNCNPLWNKKWSKHPDGTLNEMFLNLLPEYPTPGSLCLVKGHCLQSNGSIEHSGITTKLHGRVILIDLGMSRAFDRSYEKYLTLTSVEKLKYIKTITPSMLRRYIACLEITDSIREITDRVIASHYYERSDLKSNSILTPTNFTTLTKEIPTELLTIKVCDQYNEQKHELESKYDEMKQMKYRSIYKFYKQKYIQSKKQS